MKKERLTWELRSPTSTMKPRAMIATPVIKVGIAYGLKL
jgi:hypothetical protein